MHWFYIMNCSENINEIQKLIVQFSHCILYTWVIGVFAHEPKRGTRVYIEYVNANSVDRATMGNLNYYLVNRSRHIIGVSGARIESVNNNGVVLLLPGKNVSRKRLEKLTQPADLRFVILDKVATRKHPNRPWKLNSELSKKGIFEFVDSRGNKIDSAKQPDEFIKKKLLAVQNH